MTARISLHHDGLAQADAALAGLLAAAEDPTDFYDAVGGALVASTHFRFEREVDPDGNPWPPSLRAQLEGGRTLTDTARLSQSITHQADRQGVSVGTDVIYAGVHQLGAVIRPRSARALRYRLPGGLGFRSSAEVTIPARPFLGVDQDDETEISEIWGEFVAVFGASEA